MNIKVEVFSSPGCAKCGHAKDVLRKLVEELDNKLRGDTIQWREVNILEELDHAVELGVLSTPSIAINNKLVFSSLPSLKKLHNVLQAHINEAKP